MTITASIVCAATAFTVGAIAMSVYLAISAHRVGFHAALDDLLATLIRILTGLGFGVLIGDEPRTEPSYRLLETDRFEASTTCGRCGLLTVHPWREPSHAIPAVVEEEHLQVWGGGDPIRCRPLYDRPDERPFDVIRICRSCGHEWGQR